MTWPGSVLHGSGPFDAAVGASRDAEPRPLAWRAAPIAERIAALASFDRDALGAMKPLGTTPAAVLNAWRAAVAGGDDATFRRRLAADGWTEAHVAAAVTSPPPDTWPTPAWVDTFRAAVELYDASHGADRARVTEEPLPFEELLLPFVAHARACVRRRAGAAYDNAADAVHAALERALLSRLTSVAASALFAAFAAFRATHQTLSVGALFGGGGRRPLYDTFVARARRDALADFFAEYPVAARLCATAADLWVEATTELLRRAHDDAAAVATAFGDTPSSGTVVRVTTSIADPHDGGRAVAIVEWASGLRAVYKPRPLELECVFRELVAVANAANMELRAPGVLLRDGYGWVEFVATAPCADDDAAARYYERCGAVLALAYALNGTDFHLENLVAAGEHPVLIDLETLVGHRLVVGEDGDDVSGVSAGQRACDASVLRVGMLPALRFLTPGVAADIGALACAPAEGAAATDRAPAVRCWHDVNRDTMRLVTRSAVVAAFGHNVPSVGGRPVHADAHVDRIVAGFTRAYEAVCASAPALAAPGGLLDRMRRAPVRFIARNTSLYTALLDRCLHPQFLRDGALRSAELDAIARAFLVAGARAALWPLVAAERDALEQLDVPLFAAPAGDATLQLTNGVVDACFAATAYDEAAQRLASLGPVDLRRQVGLIRGAFHVHAARDVARRDLVRRDVVRRPGSCGAERPRLARSLAERTAERLLAQATVGADGELGWVTASYEPASRRYALAPVPHGLFDGSAGFALFFGALARVSSDETRRTYRDAALAAARPLTARADRLVHALRTQRAADVGAGTGTGAVIYTLATLSAWLDAPPLLATARRVAAATTAGDRRGALDLLAGHAGAVLALTALHERHGDEVALTNALSFAERLLDARATHDASGLRGWSSPQWGFEVGMAHGQSGIAYALARLGRASDDERLGAAAREAIALERELLGAGAVDATWARGAAGLGLARLGMHDGSAIDAVDDAIEQTLTALDDGVDGLCAGRMGRVDFLLVAAERLGRPDLRDAALRTAYAVAERADACGHFDTGWPDDDVTVGLFHGAAGVAYQLLRVAHPDALPSLFLWE